MFAEIIDAMIAAWKPATSRLVRRIRGNVRACSEQVFGPGCKSEISRYMIRLDSEEGQWIDVGTVYFFVPKAVVGTSATRLRIRATIKNYNFAGTLSSSVKARLRYGSDTSNEETLLNGMAANETTKTATFVLDAQGITGDEVVAIALQLNIDIITYTTGAQACEGTWRWIEGDNVANGLSRVDA